MFVNNEEHYCSCTFKVMHAGAPPGRFSWKWGQRGLIAVGVHEAKLASFRDYTFITAAPRCLKFDHS